MNSDLQRTMRTTKKRHAKRQKQQEEKLPFSGRDTGRLTIDDLLPALVEAMQGPGWKHLPRGLDRYITQMPIDMVALAGLSSLLDFLMSKEPKKHEKQVYKVRLDMGETLHQAYWEWMWGRDRRDADGAKLRRHNKRAKHRHEALRTSGYRSKNWTPEDRLRAGNWLLECCLTAMPDIFFLHNREPFMHEWAKTIMIQRCASLELRDPAFQPAYKVPAPWTGWRTGGYWDEDTPIGATFIRRGSQETEKAARRAFASGAIREHANAINRLQSVPWIINAPMLKVIRLFAGEDRKKLLSRLSAEPARKDEIKGELGRYGLPPDGGGVGKAVPVTTVLLDVTSAEEIKGRPFYLPYSCDTRGRVYPLPFLNYGREDHVRSLFLFAKGMPLDDDARKMLMIHCANCGDFDGVSKKPWGARVQWALDSRDLIERIAADPVKTVDEWRGAHARFSFVAACMELAASWRDPKFKTRLPVNFDATASGIQHLCLLMRDEVTAAKVNLVQDCRPVRRIADGRVLHDVVHVEPQDVYSEIRDSVVKAIKSQRDDTVERLGPRAHFRRKWVVGSEIKPRAKFARFWLDSGLLNGGDGRKLCKRPAMTFCYSATTPGMTEQVLDAWEDLDSTTEKLGRDEAEYLARHVYEAAQRVLVGPARAMKFLRSLAHAMAWKNLPLEWPTPVGFPWRNVYREPKTKEVGLRFRNVRGKLSLAIGDEPDIKIKKSMNAVSPNLVHALDAAHLVRVVNAAAGEGITNIAVVHDAYATLAPQAKRLRTLIGRELMLLYLNERHYSPPDDDSGSEFDVDADAEVSLKETAVFEKLLAWAKPLWEARKLRPGATRKDGRPHRFVPKRLPELPERGSLDLHIVQFAEYSFS